MSAGAIQQETTAKASITSLHEIVEDPLYFSPEADQVCAILPHPDAMLY
jgi:hypothetical protein